MTRIALLVCGLLSLCLASCSQKQPETISQVTTQLHQRLLPSGGYASAPNPPSGSGYSQSTEWEITSDNPTLRSWLESQLASDFHKVREQSDLLVFSRYDSGDTTEVELRLGPPSHVHVHLTVRPD